MLIIDSKFRSYLLMWSFSIAIPTALNQLQNLDSNYTLDATFFELYRQILNCYFLISPLISAAAKVVRKIIWINHFFLYNRNLFGFPPEFTGVATSDFSINRAISATRPSSVLGVSAIPISNSFRLYLPFWTHRIASASNSPFKERKTARIRVDTEGPYSL